MLQKQQLDQKMLWTKVAQNWISYKKLGGCVSLSIPGVEVGGSNDLPFLKYYNGQKWESRFSAEHCKKYWLDWKILQTKVEHKFS